MLNSSQLDSLAQKLCSVLPTSFGQVEEGIRDTFKSILQVAFSELDLVTREEFDAQVKVLARTREKVDFLQKEIDQRLNQKAD